MHMKGLIQYLACGFTYSINLTYYNYYHLFLADIRRRSCIGKFKQEHQLLVSHNLGAKDWNRVLCSSVFLSLILIKKLRKPTKITNSFWRVSLGALCAPSGLQPLFYLLDRWWGLWGQVFFPRILRSKAELKHTLGHITHSLFKTLP